MGRLDDIVQRNSGKAPYDGLTKLVDKLPDGKQPEVAQRFQLPSQRKRSVPVWKVLLLMVLIGTVVGVYAFVNAERDQEWREHHGR